MQENRRVLTTALALCGFLLCLLLSKSCANTTTPPSGGPKDTIPPVLMKVNPDFNATNFPRYDGKIALTYDEYTVVKNPSDIYLSPPMRKRVTHKIKGKNIVFSIPDTLAENRTYTLDFGESLADNNEGNIAPRLVYAFSTGPTVDSLYITGNIIDCQTLQPVEKVLVALYTDHSDSACFNIYPDAASKSDKWGFFSIRNIRDTLYRMVAFTDSDNDSKYDPTKDQIAFLDTLIRPVDVIRDSIYELMPFDMKDTLACEARHSMYELLIFTELQSVQFLKNSGRSSEKVGFLSFNAPDVEIADIEFFGIADSCVIIQYTPARDSLDFWINTPNRLEDSLLIKLNYKRTDSTGVLRDTIENLSLALPKPEAASGRQAEQKPKDTVFNFRVDAKNENIAQDGISLTSALPIIDSNKEMLILTATNPRHQTDTITFKFEQDPQEIRRFIMYMDREIRDGYEYEFTVPQGSFFNLDNLPNAEVKTKFNLPQTEDACSITLELTGVETRYIVELVDKDRKDVFRKYNIERDTSLLFPYLRPQEYSVRITEDRNRNGLFDSGNFLDKRQPEKVRMYQPSPGVYILTLPEMTDLIQTIDIKEMFK
ncbi:MAG: Ig-like domain-containing protein [Bacteroidales bacterium]|nr:Ig-like domain-containing protein [Bacteroidales bacterium]